MKKSRLRMNLYELCDWKAIEHHLARQAAKGWRLRRAEGSFWRYERAEPACVQYEVTYLPSVGETTPRPDPGNWWYKFCGSAHHRNGVHF